MRFGVSYRALIGFGDPFGASSGALFYWAVIGFGASFGGFLVGFV